MTTQMFIGTLELHHCIQCGVAFGLTSEFRKARQEDHRNLWCPNNHSQHYPQKNREEELEAQLEASRKTSERQREWLRAEEGRRQRAERQAAARKGQVTKIKNRVAKGVCPCCNRQFVNLERHMSGQHPEWAEPS